MIPGVEGLGLELGRTYEVYLADDRRLTLVHVTQLA